MLYFAYGSKMNTNEMNRVCNGKPYKVIGKCKLLGYRFEYNGHSKTWNGPAGDIIESKNDFVWGVLYEIGEKCKPFLDKSEGYLEDRPDSKNTYKLIDVTKFIDSCDGQYGKDDIFSYKHVNTPKVGKLSCDYKKIVVCGAQQHKIPEDYITKFLDASCVKS